MIDTLINTIISCTILVIISIPIFLFVSYLKKICLNFKNRIEKNNIIEKTDDEIEYDNNFFEELKRKNEKYEKEKNESK